MPLDDDLIVKNLNQLPAQPTEPVTARTIGQIMAGPSAFAPVASPQRPTLTLPRLDTRARQAPVYDDKAARRNKIMALLAMVGGVAAGPRRPVLSAIASGVGQAAGLNQQEIDETYTTRLKGYQDFLTDAQQFNLGQASNEALAGYRSGVDDFEHTRDISRDDFEHDRDLQAEIEEEKRAKAAEEDGRGRDYHWWKKKKEDEAKQEQEDYLFKLENPSPRDRAALINATRPRSSSRTAKEEKEIEASLRTAQRLQLEIDEIERDLESADNASTRRMLRKEKRETLSELESVRKRMPSDERRSALGEPVAPGSSTGGLPAAISTRDAARLDLSELIEDPNASLDDLRAAYLRAQQAGALSAEEQAELRAIFGDQ